MIANDSSLMQSAEVFEWAPPGPSDWELSTHPAI